jgi:hypothetical protein
MGKFDFLAAIGLLAALPTSTVRDTISTVKKYTHGIAMPVALIFQFSAAHPWRKKTGGYSSWP